MEKVKNFLRQFVAEEDGMEFLQVALIVAFVIGCVGALGYVMTKVTESLNDAGNLIDSQLNPGP